jgi:hypothetical protein
MHELSDIVKLRIKLLKEELTFHQKNYMEAFKHFNLNSYTGFGKLNAMRDNIVILKRKLERLHSTHEGRFYL